MRFDVFSGYQRGLVIAAAAAVALIVGDARCEEPALSSASDPYPLQTCVILDAPLFEGAEIIDIDGREIRVCCEECVGEFGQGATWIAVIDERIIQQQTPYYPLATCLVDGKPLDDVSTVNHVFRNRLFRLCSHDCCESLGQDPEKYFGLLNKAVIKEQKPTYPLSTCIVSAEPLGKDAIDYVVGNQLIRLASLEQIDKFNENPGKYLADLRKLAKKKSKKK